MTVLLTALALLAFAANSILCRLALAAGSIDPVSFTAIRLGSGALMLWPIAACAHEPATAAQQPGSWWSGFVLFAYAMAFSLAYVSLPAGTGALLLFGAVQLTMLGVAAHAGHGLRTAQWLGFLLALTGLTALVFPGLASPDPIGAMLMTGAGVAWGIYSIRGRGAAAPTRLTAGNFVRATPFAIACLLPAPDTLNLSPRGVLLALASGAVTSGLGYVIWYRALRGLAMTQAAVVQLLVPVLACTAGVLLLGEVLTTRLLVASLLTIGGVALAVRPRPD